MRAERTARYIEGPEGDGTSTPRRSVSDNPGRQLANVSTYQVKERAKHEASCALRHRPICASALHRLLDQPPLTPIPGNKRMQILAPVRLVRGGDAAHWPLALDTDCSYIVRMQAPVLNRAEAIERVSACEAEIRALGVSRLALFGSVLEERRTPTAMSIFSCNSSRARRPMTAFSRYRNCWNAV